MYSEDCSLASAQNTFALDEIIAILTRNAKGKLLGRLQSSTLHGRNDYPTIVLSEEAALSTDNALLSNFSFNNDTEGRLNGCMPQYTMRVGWTVQARAPALQQHWQDDALQEATKMTREISPVAATTANMQIALNGQLANKPPKRGISVQAMVDFHERRCQKPPGPGVHPPHRITQTAKGRVDFSVRFIGRGKRKVLGEP